MRITHVSIHRLDFKLLEPYTIAYETVTTACNLVVRIQTSEGLVGLGCAAPDLEVTGETPEQVIAGAEAYVLSKFVGRDGLRRSALTAPLDKSLKELPSLRAAVDVALYDLLAKKARLPLYRVLGGHRRRIRTSVTIGICDVQETLERARDWINRGFQCLKIKGGADVNTDIERMIKLREAVGPKIELRFDANQGYSVGETVHFVKGIDKVDLEVLEQPTPREAKQQLGEVTKAVPVLVMADEAMLSTLDAFQLARHGLVDLVNIKLMKVGGITEALRVNSIARVARIPVMVGCMDECELSISAGLHFALSGPNIHYADLDGHLDLIDDPTRGAFSLKDGWLIPSEKPGLGVTDLDFS